MSWLTGEWSTLYRVTGHVGQPWHDACPRDLPGLYRLVALTDVDKLETAVLNRVCGEDPTGTIYIGAARIVRNRVGQLNQQHTVGRAHKVLPSTLSKAFPRDRLAFCWRLLNKSDDPFRHEYELMTAYKAAFGETPPLNGQG